MALTKKPKTETLPAQNGNPAIKFKRGGLHTATSTPQGKPIPAAKKRKALAGGYGPKAKKEAQFAKNVLNRGD